MSDWRQSYSLVTGLYLLIAAALAFCPAMWAGKKNRQPTLWYLAGFLLPPVAILCIWLADPLTEDRTLSVRWRRVRQQPAAMVDVPDAWRWLPWLLTVALVALAMLFSILIHANARLPDQQAAQLRLGFRLVLCFITGGYCAGLSFLLPKTAAHTKGMRVAGFLLMACGLFLTLVRGSLSRIVADEVPRPEFFGILLGIAATLMFGWLLASYAIRADNHWAAWLFMAAATAGLGLVLCGFPLALGFVKWTNKVVETEEGFFRVAYRAYNAWLPWAYWLTAVGTAGVLTQAWRRKKTPQPENSER